MESEQTRGVPAAARPRRLRCRLSKRLPGGLRRTGVVLGGALRRTTVRRLTAVGGLAVAGWLLGAGANAWADQLPVSHGGAPTGHAGSALPQVRKDVAKGVATVHRKVHETVPAHRANPTRVLPDARDTAVRTIDSVDATTRHATGRHETRRHAMPDASRRPSARRAIGHALDGSVLTGAHRKPDPPASPHSARHRLARHAPARPAPSTPPPMVSAGEPAGVAPDTADDMFFRDAGPANTEPADANPMSVHAASGHPTSENRAFPARGSRHTGSPHAGSPVRSAWSGTFTGHEAGAVPVRARSRAARPPVAGGVHALSGTHRMSCAVRHPGCAYVPLPVRPGPQAPDGGSHSDGHGMVPSPAGVSSVAGRADVARIAAERLPQRLAILAARHGVLPPAVRTAADEPSLSPD